MPDTPQPDTPQPETSEPEATEPEAPAPNRKIFILFALIFLVAFVGIRWWYFTGQALEQVAVESSVPACTGTTIGEVQVDGKAVAAPDVVAGMRCEVIVNVINEGTKTLTVSHLVAPGLGSDSSLPVRAAEVDGREPADAGDAADASYAIDQDLEGGEFLEINVAYEYDDSGCLESATYADARWPSVEVTASNRSRSVDANRTFALRSTDESTC